MTDVAVRRLFRVVNGGTPKSDEANWGGDVLWATPIDLAAVDGDSIASTARTLTREGLRSGSATVPAGSLIVSTRAPIGYVAGTTAETAFNQGCRGLVPQTDLDLGFFRYQLVGRRADLVSRGQGSTFAELASDSLAAFKLSCPPLKEQRQISAFLETETAWIDGLIETKRRMVALLRERWRVARRRAVTVGLASGVPCRRTNALWLEDVPSHWRTSRLAQLGEMASGSTPSTDRDDYWNGDVPWVSPKDMKQFDLDSTEERVSQRAVQETGLAVVEAGSVLFVVRGMILAHTFPVAICSVRVTINQDMKALTIARRSSLRRSHARRRKRFDPLAPGRGIRSRNEGSAYGALEELPALRPTA